MSTTPREEFQEAVMCSRKAVYEFALSKHPEDYEEMLTWQRRLFELYDKTL